jgi:hypothetical protein
VLTLAACAIWTFAAISATWTGFDAVAWPVKAALAVVAVYCVVLTVWSSYFRREASPSGAD